MINAGRLSDTIIFQVRTVTVVNDQNVVAWAHQFTERAEVDRQGGALSRRYLIRYRTAPDGNPIKKETHRIVFEGYLWPITNIEPDRRRTELSIDCDGTELVEVTDLQSTERDYISGVPAVPPPSEE